LLIFICIFLVSIAHRPCVAVNRHRHHHSIIALSSSAASSVYRPRGGSSSNVDIKLPLSSSSSPS
jgi:hypothetical protein